MHPRRAKRGHSLALASRRAQDRFAGSETEHMILIPSSQCSPGGPNGRGRLRFLVREVRRHSPSRREGVTGWGDRLVLTIIECAARLFDRPPPQPPPDGRGRLQFLVGGVRRHSHFRHSPSRRARGEGEDTACPGWTGTLEMYPEFRIGFG